MRKAGTRKIQPAEVRQKPNTLEQIMKSRQNQGQILRKYISVFRVWNTYPPPYQKICIIFLAKQKTVADRQNQLPLFNQSSARDNYIYI